MITTSLATHIQLFERKKFNCSSLSDFDTHTKTLPECGKLSPNRNKRLLAKEGAQDLSNGK